MESSGPHDLPRVLHADDRWLRDLSRRLLRDTALADDAVQETWLSVLRSPPTFGSDGSGGIPRGFLATALRNVIGKLRRGDSRRAARETDYASSSPLHARPLAGVIERLELRRVMLDAVLELPDPYRDVLLLRFYEDLPVARIAQQAGVPRATVKTRLRRAEEMLAARLDAKANGDRGTYLPALIATAQPTLGGALLTTVAGVVVMALKQKLVFVTVALLVGAAGFVLFDSMARNGEPTKTRALAAAPTVKLEPPSLDGRAPELAPAERSAVPPAEVGKPSSQTPAAATATRDLDGQVFDAYGKAFARAQLVFQQTNVHDALPVKFESDATGRFHAEIPKEALGVVDGVDPNFATLYEGVVQSISQQIAPVVVLAPRIQLAGSVVDHDGDPIAGASIQVEIPRTFRELIPVPTENSRESWVSATAGKDGRFAMDSVPLVAGSRIVVAATGYPTLVTQEPGASDGTLRFVLERPAAGDKNRVRGQVVDSFGVPVAGARVMFGMAFDRSDERGFFDLDRSQAWKAPAIRAIREGFTPAELKWPLDPPSDFVTLTLGPKAVAIRGIVRYADGTPAAKVSVQPAELDVLGFFDGRMVSAEEFSGGYEHSVETDASGAFELDGLLRKSYVLRIVSATRGFAYRTAPILADGPSTTIDLPKDLSFEKVRGRIVDRHGDAIVGATVGIQVTFWKASYLGSTNASNNVVGTVKSGSDGKFVLTDVPRLEGEILASCEEILPIAIRVPQDAGEKEIEIVAERRCHFSLELPANDPATYFTAQDEHGESLQLTVEQAGETKISSSQTLTAGRSGVVIVSDRATTFVLFKDLKELRRISVNLKAGETMTVRG